MTQTIPCTAQVLTRDSGASIRACLDGLRRFAEVIVQDGASTDDTREIARSYPNVRVLDQNPAYLDRDGRIVDFAAMRNESLAAARHPWIFVCDSDEDIPASLTEEIAGIVSGNVPGVHRVFRRFFIGAEPIAHCAGYPAYQIRLFHRSCVDGYAKSVHEKLLLRPGVHTQTLHSELSVPLPPPAVLERKYERYLAMETRRIGVLPWKNWFRWIVFRNLRSALGLLVLTGIVWLKPATGKKMPFAYDWQTIRQLLKLIVVTFPPLARKRHATLH